MSKKIHEGGFWRQLAAKGIIIGVYLTVLAGALYSPLFFNLFRTEKSINVYAFTETFSTEVLQLFERETGIKVNVTYAEMDEEIGAKFAINRGAGYDVVNVSDFMAHHLHKSGYLQKINHQKIKNISRINQRLLKQDYDPASTYAIPHKWFMYGIIYDRNFFNIAPENMSLAAVFARPEKLVRAGLAKSKYRVCMIDSPLDAYFVSMLYTFGRFDAFTPEQHQLIAKNLSLQKEWVECYTLYTVEYFLLSGIVPIALTSSNFVRKIWARSDQYEFAIPKEGGVLVIENLVIPKMSKRADLAHKFIDFMLSDKIATLNSRAYGWTSANAVANQTLDDECRGKRPASHLFPDERIFKRLHIPLFSSSARKYADDAWLRVGFAR